MLVELAIATDGAQVQLLPPAIDVRQEITRRCRQGDRGHLGLTPAVLDLEGRLAEPTGPDRGPAGRGVIGQRPVGSQVFCPRIRRPQVGRRMSRRYGGGGARRGRPSLGDQVDDHRLLAVAQPQFDELPRLSISTEQSVLARRRQAQLLPPAIDIGQHVIVVIAGARRQRGHRHFQGTIGRIDLDGCIAESGTRALVPPVRELPSGLLAITREAGRSDELPERLDLGSDRLLGADHLQEPRPPLAWDDGRQHPPATLMRLSHLSGGRGHDGVIVVGGLCRGLPGSGIPGDTRVFPTAGQDGRGEQAKNQCPNSTPFD